MMQKFHMVYLAVTMMYMPELKDMETTGSISVKTDLRTKITMVVHTRTT